MVSSFQAWIFFVFNVIQEDSMNSPLLFGIATLSYLVAMVLYISYLAFRKNGIGQTATIVTVAGFLVQTAALLLRLARIVPDGHRPGAAVQPLRIAGFFHLEHGPDLSYRRVQVQDEGLRRLRNARCVPGACLHQCLRHQLRHYAAGPRIKEQLAVLPRPGQLSRLRGVRRRVCNQHDLPAHGY